MDPDLSSTGQWSLRCINHEYGQHMLLSLSVIVAWFEARLTWGNEDEGKEVRVCHNCSTWLTMLKNMLVKGVYKEGESLPRREIRNTIHYYEIASAYLDGILPTTKNPNEVMVMSKLWENNNTTFGWDEGNDKLTRSLGAETFHHARENGKGQ